jgi:hypothetical protein
MAPRQSGEMKSSGNGPKPLPLLSDSLDYITLRIIHKPEVDCSTYYFLTRIFLITRLSSVFKTTV